MLADISGKYKTLLNCKMVLIRVHEATDSTSEIFLGSEDVFTDQEDTVCDSE